jgi:hypothetical protein
MPLPIDQRIDALVASLMAHPALVLKAQPGAGKTTRVPPALLDGKRHPRRTSAALSSACVVGRPADRSAGVRAAATGDARRGVVRRLGRSETLSPMARGEALETEAGDGERRKDLVPRG